MNNEQTDTQTTNDKNEKQAMWEEDTNGVGRVK
jgi:hypothetical protein